MGNCDFSINKSEEPFPIENDSVINIQDNIYDFKQNHWYIFTVKDYATLKQLPYEGQVKVADKFGMRVVPLLWTGTLKDVMPDVDAAVAFANGETPAIAVKY